MNSFTYLCKRVFQINKMSGPLTLRHMLSSLSNAKSDNDIQATYLSTATLCLLHAGKAFAKIKLIPAGLIWLDCSSTFNQNSSWLKKPAAKSRKIFAYFMVLSLTSLPTYDKKSASQKPNSGQTLHSTPNHNIQHYETTTYILSSYPTNYPTDQSTH